MAHLLVWPPSASRWRRQLLSDMTFDEAVKKGYIKYVNTQIIYDNTKRKYAVAEVVDKDDITLDNTALITRWVTDPADATTLSESQAARLKAFMTMANGPSMDGSVEIREQMSEVTRFKNDKRGGYKDSGQYLDYDDTDIA